MPVSARPAVTIAVIVLAVSSASGFAQTPQRWVIESVTIGVPGAPDGGSWDSILGSIFSLNLPGVQPDVRICFESTNVPASCTGVCEDARGSEELGNVYMCTQSLRPNGLLLQGNLHVVAQDIDVNSVQPIADFLVKDPTKCEPWCTLKMPGGTLIITFTFAQVQAYGGPYRGVAGTIPPPSSTPVAEPGSGGGPAPARKPTPEEVDAALALRDADNCVGSDMFFPQGTVLTRSLLGQQLGTDQANRLYQMAAFASSISDPTLKQQALNDIRSRVGDDTFYGVMTLIIGDVNQSRALTAAAQEGAEFIVEQIVNKQLDKVLPVLKPPSAIVPDIERWIIKKLTEMGTGKVIDMMYSGPRTISAECARNQLAKDGFIDTIYGR